MPGTRCGGMFLIATQSTSFAIQLYSPNRPPPVTKKAEGLSRTLAPSRDLRCCPAPHLQKDREHLVHLCRWEHTLDAERVEVGVGRFVESSRLHYPVLRQVVDDEVNQVDLVGAQSTLREKAGERLLRGRSIQSDQRPDEKPQPRRLRLGPFHIVLTPDTVLAQHALELLEI